MPGFDALTPIPEKEKEKRISQRDLLTAAIKGRQLAWVTLNADDLDIANKNLKNASAIKFTAHGTTITPNDQEILLEDNTTNQRLRLKFANNATQWQVDLTDTCTPVKRKDYGKKYFKKYDLMTELDDSRFKNKYPKDDKNVQEEYRGQPVSHFPSMGDDGTARQEHNEAMWERPWLPMRRIPDRMETMGQFPYPPVHSSLIGENETKVNLYQLLAHAYNQLQERCDGLEARIAELEKGAVL